MGGGIMNQTLGSPHLQGRFNLTFLVIRRSMQNIFSSLLSPAAIPTVKYKMQSSYRKAYSRFLGIGYILYDCLPFLLLVDSFIESIRNSNFVFINVCVFMCVHMNTYMHIEVCFWRSQDNLTVDSLFPLCGFQGLN